MTRPLGIVGLMAVLALAGTGCAGSDGTPPAQAGAADAPLTTTTDDPVVDGDTSTGTAPSTDDAGPTCSGAVDDLTSVLGATTDLPAALQAQADPATLQVTAADVGKVLDHAAGDAARAGQDDAAENLEVLGQMLGDVRAALGEGAADPMDAYMPAYFEHGYAAAALRDLAATANLAPCGEVADLVVGADG
ncbi:hypothetical protein B7486_56735 [cyanobacterium TDX16]|nr:hypothetical protein B7486_56735 [cyanobacterium TDX16]